MSNKADKKNKKIVKKWHEQIFGQAEAPIEKFFADFSILGLAIGSVLGLSASSLSKSVSQDIIMPVLLPALSIGGDWTKKKIKVGKFELGVGNFTSELIVFTIVVIVIYFLFAFVFRKFMRNVLYHRTLPQVTSERNQERIIKELKRLNNRAPQIEINEPNVDISSEDIDDESI